MSNTNNIIQRAVAGSYRSRFPVCSSMQNTVQDIQVSFVKGRVCSVGRGVSRVAGLDGPGFVEDGLPHGHLLRLLGCGHLLGRGGLQNETADADNWWQEDVFLDKDTDSTSRVLFDSM